MDQSLSNIVEQALEQALALCRLDAPRAEAWASDLMALAAEVAVDADADESIAVMLRRLEAEDGIAARVAVMSVCSLLGTEGADPRPGSVACDPDLPEWVEALGTSRCDGAWVFSNRRGDSAVFRFVDSADATHAISVDLLPDLPETVGEVMVGPADVVDLADDPDSDIDAVSTDPVALAARVARAVCSTGAARETLVVNGRLLVERLSRLTDEPVVVPNMATDVVPETPPFDPDDDAHALGVLRRALGAESTDPTVGSGEPAHVTDSLARAASVLRQAAEVDDPVARWLAASRGPVDLDDTDSAVVIAALASAVRPHDMVPLDSDAREAVAALEWADWLGVVIGLVREGPGASTDPAHMVDLINRCPEVTSTIPKADRARVEWSLAVSTESWEKIGMATDDELTPMGEWALPQMLWEAWRRDG